MGIKHKLQNFFGRSVGSNSNRISSSVNSSPAASSDYSSSSPTSSSTRSDLSSSSSASSDRSSSSSSSDRSSSSTSSPRTNSSTSSTRSAEDGLKVVRPSELTIKTQTQDFADYFHKNGIAPLSKPIVRQSSQPHKHETQKSKVTGAERAPQGRNSTRLGYAAKFRAPGGVAEQMTTALDAADNARYRTSNTKVTPNSAGQKPVNTLREADPNRGLRNPQSRVTKASPGLFSRTSGRNVLTPIPESPSEEASPNIIPPSPAYEPGEASHAEQNPQKSRAFFGDDYSTEPKSSSTAAGLDDMAPQPKRMEPTLDARPRSNSRSR